MGQRDQNAENEVDWSPQNQLSTINYSTLYLNLHTICWDELSVRQHPPYLPTKDTPPSALCRAWPKNLHCGWMSDKDTHTHLPLPPHWSPGHNVNTSRPPSSCHGKVQEESWTDCSTGLPLLSRSLKYSPFWFSITALSRKTEPGHPRGTEWGHHPAPLYRRAPPHWVLTQQNQLL